MNIIRERIITNMPSYLDFAKHKDLIAFCVCSECLTTCKDEDIEPDFDEIVVAVEKDWLFDYMQMENPLEYLQNEYTSDDSINWFNAALEQNKIAMIEFN